MTVTEIMTLVNILKAPLPTYDEWLARHGLTPEGMLNVVSYGGGTNSTAMLIGMQRLGFPVHLILFADTGAERPETYEYIEIFSDWLEKHDMPRITPVCYYDKNGNRLTLEDECLRACTLPSIAYGFKKCSLKHKIGTQEKYCNNDSVCQSIWRTGGQVQKFIGYDAGEARRVLHAASIDAMEKKYRKHYLLYEWGWTRETCVEAIIDAGLPLPGKSSCFFCPSMKKAEIQDLWERHPELFARAVALERNAKETLTTTKGLGRRRAWEDYQKAYFENLEAERAQLSLFDFVDSPGGCLCGAPCGCYDG